MGEKLKVFRETTKDWSVPQKNHTYILSSNKQWLYGYIPEGATGREVIMMANRLQFNTRYRTFREVK